MEKIFKILVIASALSLSAHSMGGETYYGGGLTAMDVSGGYTDRTLGTIHGLVGYRFNEYYAAETRLGTTINDNNPKVEKFGGFYLKGGRQVSETIYPYAIVGYTIGTYNDTSESAPSYGVGVAFSMIYNVKLNLEYISYLNKDGAEFLGFSLGFSKPF
tara:strand:- start:357 stop:833 length:477 start_codon:yes stop_codon:yes gene_type:complete